MRPARSHGFTLLEVLLAFFVMATTLTGLVMMVSQNVARLATAREEAEARRLAEERARELLASEEPPELGFAEGDFESPHEDLRWQVVVEPYPLPLPAGREHLRTHSSIFAEPTTIADAPQPSVRRAVVRVFRSDAEPDTAEPWVVFAVEPGNFASAGSQADGTDEPRVELP